MAWGRRSRSEEEESGDVQRIHGNIDRELKGRALCGGRYLDAAMRRFFFWLFVNRWGGI